MIQTAKTTLQDTYDAHIPAHHDQRWRPDATVTRPKQPSGRVPGYEIGPKETKHKDSNILEATTKEKERKEKGELWGNRYALSRREGRLSSTGEQGESKLQLQ